jgi:hypothetical protein
MSAVEALSRETPSQLMAQLRAVWPLVQSALEAGHTLRLIHKRLNLAGVQISYKRLSVYRGRIERGKKEPATPGSGSIRQALPMKASSFEAREIRCIMPKSLGKGGVGSQPRDA